MHELEAELAAAKVGSLGYMVGWASKGLAVATGNSVRKQASTTPLLSEPPPLSQVRHPLFTPITNTQEVVSLLLWLTVYCFCLMVDGFLD